MLHQGFEIRVNCVRELECASLSHYDKKEVHEEHKET